MRIGEVSRTTAETDIRVKIDLDGKGRSNIETGIGFSIICLQPLLSTDFSILRSLPREIWRSMPTIL